MKIAILAVGTELLMGKTVNTNATELSKVINDIGHSVLYHLTIGDNPERLQATLDYLLSVTDMVITTGGLGPTQDDLTKEVIAKTLGKDMAFNQQAYDNIVKRFKAYNAVMTDNNKKQAYLPEDAILMPNAKGTAPGFICEANDKIVAALPGPPHEMRHMLESSLKDYLKSKSDMVIKSEYINLFGIGESSAETKVMDLISSQSNPTIAIYANIGQVSLRVTASARTDQEASRLLEPTVKEISYRLKDYLLGYGEKNIIDFAVDGLNANNLSISLAESCTGGLIAAEFIKYSGASSFFDRGHVTYSNQAKIDILNVLEETLEEHGAVSEETCLEMVQGLGTSSDVSLAVTGIAGPTGGSKEKPVGLVYIGVRVKDYLAIRKFNFTGDRMVIRRRSLLYAMDMIINGIKKTCN